MIPNPIPEVPRPAKSASRAPMRLRINGTSYALAFSKYREVVNGQEVGFVVDHNRREIRFDRSFRCLINEVVSQSRRSFPRAKAGQH